MRISILYLPFVSYLFKKKNLNKYLLVDEPWTPNHDNEWIQFKLVLFHQGITQNLLWRYLKVLKLKL